MHQGQNPKRSNVPYNQPPPHPGGPHLARGNNPVQTVSIPVPLSLGNAQYPLKPNHHDYPIFIDVGTKEDPHRRIYIEKNHPKYEVAYQFLIKVAQYVSRCALVHVYQINMNSLYTAMVLQIPLIVETMNQLCKNAKVPADIEQYILKFQSKYGTAKLSLVKGEYRLKIEEKEYQRICNEEPSFGQKLEKIVDTAIYDDIVTYMEDKNSSSQGNQKQLTTFNNEQHSLNLLRQDSLKSIKEKRATENQDSDDSIDLLGDDESDDGDNMLEEALLHEDAAAAATQAAAVAIAAAAATAAATKVVPTKRKSAANQKAQEHKFLYFTLYTHHYEFVTKQLFSRKLPLIQVFNYEKGRLDDQGHELLKIEMVPKAKPRDYQEQALKNVFRNGIASSGVIVLPCGAGKTLVGILIMNQIKRSTIILCDRDVTVQQWKREILNWCNIEERFIINYQGKNKNGFKDNPMFRGDMPGKNQAFILIATYHSMQRIIKENSDKQQRGANNRPEISGMPKDNYSEITDEQIKKLIKDREWGLLLADEVQTLPAENYKNILNYKFRVKIGLTATPYRGDNNINLIFQLIGPKLYEEELKKLIDLGYLARPYCVEVRCEFSELFKEAYRRCQQGQNRKQRRVRIHCGNPTKLRALKFLIEKHEERGDSILVFCDSTIVLKIFSSALARPVLYGKVQTNEREFIFQLFRQKKVKTLFCSKIADTGIDLPDANVAIQIGGQFGSSRQEVQRLGRIMRKKPNQKGEYNAFFYNFVSLESDEVDYNTRRQKTLVNQGLSFEIIDEERDLYGEKERKRLDDELQSHYDLLYKKIVEVDGNLDSSDNPEEEDSN